MNNLSAFLNPLKTSEIEIVVSDRFKDESNVAIAWKIKPIEAGLAQDLMRKYQKIDKKGNQSFDNAGYQLALVTEAVVYPDLNDASLQKGYSVLGAGPLLNKMLLIGEYAQLRTQVFELSGLFDDINEKIEEAKN